MQDKRPVFSGFLQAADRSLLLNCGVTWNRSDVDISMFIYLLYLNSDSVIRWTLRFSVVIFKMLTNLVDFFIFDEILIVNWILKIVLGWFHSVCCCNSVILPGMLHVSVCQSVFFRDAVYTAHLAVSFADSATNVGWSVITLWNCNCLVSVDDNCRRELLYIIYTRPASRRPWRAQVAVRDQNSAKYASSAMRRRRYISQQRCRRAEVNSATTVLGRRVFLWRRVHGAPLHIHNRMSEAIILCPEFRSSTQTVADRSTLSCSCRKRIYLLRRLARRFVTAQLGLRPFYVGLMLSAICIIIPATFVDEL